MAIDKRVNTRFTAKDGITKRFSLMERAAARFGRQGEKSFRRINRSSGGLFKRLTSMKTLLAGAVAGVATGAIAQSVIKTAELGDEAAKTSRRLGITAEALQELRFAADRQGVSNSVLQSSFTALQKRVGEFRAGTGSLQTFMKKFNDKALSVQLKRAKNVDEAFMILTKRMKTIKNPMDRAALASAAFSRAGVDMLKFMEAGEDGIKALRMEAQKYGGVISNEAAADSELFIDAMTNMQAAITGIKNTFGAELIPEVTKAMQTFADFVAQNRGLIKLKSAEWVDKLVEGLRIAWPIIKGIADVVGFAATKFVEIGKGLGIAAAKASMFFEAIPSGVVNFLETNIGGFGSDFDPDNYGPVKPRLMTGEFEETTKAPNEEVDRARASALKQSLEATIRLKADQGTSATVEENSGVPGFNISMQGAS